MRITLLCLISIFYLTSISWAQTWDGGGDGVNWSSANNWSTDLVPVSSGVVVIPNGSTVTVDGDYTCNTLTFTGAAATLQVNAGFTLVVSGAITINHIAAGSNNTSITGAGSMLVGSVVIGAATPTLAGSGNTKFNVSVNSFSCNGNLSLNSRNNSGNNANASFSLQSGTFTLGGRIIPNISTSSGQGASFLMNEGSANGTLVLTNDAPWQTDNDFNTASGWGTNSTGSAGSYTVNLNGANSTVVYNKNGDQVINRARAGTSGTVAVTYRNLTLSGTSTLPTTNNKSLPSTSTATITGTLSFQGTAVMTGTQPTYAVGSTLEYKGSEAQTTAAFEFRTLSTAPSNLIIDNPLGVTLHADRTLRTSGLNSITLRNGNFNNSSFNVTMATGSTIIRGGGSFQSTPLFPASVNLTYEQTGASITSALEVPLSTTVLSDININNTNGVVFNRDITLNGTLTLTKGVLTLNSGFILHITSGNAITGSGFGLLKHIITQNNPVSGSIAYIRTGSFTGSRTFPLGEGNYYMPATLSSAGTNDFNVAVFSEAALNGQPNGSSFTSLSPIVNANWIINRNTGTTATDITFSWSESLEGATFSAAADNQIGISRFDGSNWDPLTGTLGDNSGNTVTRTGVNTFSPFIVAVLGTPLPLKFGNISAARNGQAINVKWEAISEENVAYYEVEKSYTGRSFNKAGVVNALANNTSLFTYSWIDAAPGNGMVFYRIKAVDNDGQFKYSPIVKVASENASRGLNVYPNPVQANGRFNIEAGSLPRGTYTIELIDMIGVRAFTRLIDHAGGSLTQNMELSKSLKPGTYVIKFSGENVSYTSMVIVK
jgi:hypothetical protein